MPVKILGVELAKGSEAGAGFTGTEGSVPFVGALGGALTEDNAGLAYNATLKELTVTSVDGEAVVGVSNSSQGVHGTSVDGVGVRGTTSTGYGVEGVAGAGGGAAVSGSAQAGNAAFFASTAEANTNATVVVMRFSAGALADLVQVIDQLGAKMFAINKTGGIFATLPTANPLVAGQLWNDVGTVKVSAG
jgi:hypothetical protein